MKSNFQDKSDVMAMPFLRFLYILFQIVIFGFALIPCLFLIRIFSHNLVLFAFSISFSFFLFIFLIIVYVGILKFFIRDTKQGIWKINSKETKIYMLNLALTETINRTPLYSLIHLHPFFYNLFYNLIGMKHKKFFLGNNVRIVDPWNVELGDNVIIGDNCEISGHVFENNKLIVKKIKIGNNVVIGAGSYISPGVEIGDGSIVGALSALKKFTKIGKSELWYGKPARKIRKLN